MAYTSRNTYGYGQYPPKPHWPNNAYIAVQFVLDYEGENENDLFNGEQGSEASLSNGVGASQWSNQFQWNKEFTNDYGARAGFWRLHRLFTEKNIPVTVYAVATALMRSPAQVGAMQDAGWEIASHGYKWIERQQINHAIRLHTHATGQRPLGLLTERPAANIGNTVDGEHQFEYISDTYDDDLPYWREHEGKPQLIIPYTLDANDMKFATAQGFNSGDQFYAYLRDLFDTLYEEGQTGSPKMMTVGLHCRLIGRPGRIRSLARFIDYVQSHEKVWIPTRIDIARHWNTTHPFVKRDLTPSHLDRETFVEQFGGIFEHSPWIAERAFDGELARANDTAIGLHFALRTQFRAASAEERLRVLRAHPDLAGKLAAAKRLTADSTAEQAAVGLDSLTDDERTLFTELNAKYTSKFGFPFIICAKDNTKASIVEAFKRRLENDRESEFETACAQVERIAYLRLETMLHD